MLIKVYSVLVTLGTSMLWVEGEISSNFLPVKIYSRDDRIPIRRTRSWRDKSNNELGEVKHVNIISMPIDATHLEKLTSMAVKLTLA